MVVLRVELFHGNDVSNKNLAIYVFIHIINIINYVYIYLCLYIYLYKSINKYVYICMHLASYFISKRETTRFKTSVRLVAIEIGVKLLHEESYRNVHT